MGPPGAVVLVPCKEDAGKDHSLGFGGLQSHLIVFDMSPERSIYARILNFGSGISTYYDHLEVIWTDQKDLTQSICRFINDACGILMKYIELSSWFLNHYRQNWVASEFYLGRHKQVVNLRPGR